MKPVVPALAGAMLAALVAGVQAQDQFPSRPVQIIVPATPGGPVDTAMRMIEPSLAAALGQPVVLLNKPGASGTLGMHDVATADPNGYTLGQGINSIFTITRISGTSVPFTVDDFRTDYTFVFGRFRLTPNVEYSMYRYGSTNILNGGAGVNQSFSDANVLQGGIALRYGEG